MNSCDFVLARNMIEAVCKIISVIKQEFFLNDQMSFDMIDSAI